MTMTPPDPNLQQQQPPPDPQNPPPVSFTVNNPPAPAPPPASTAELEALFNAERERVRKEEKDKLYPQIETLGQQVAALTKEREDRLAAEQSAQQAAAEQERQRLEAEQTQLQRFEVMQQEQANKLHELEEVANRERAMREKEAELAQITQYRWDRLQQEQENIAPQLADFVSGTTKEQVDKSIELVKAKTAEILSKVQEQQLGARREMAPPISGAPPVDMMGQGENQRTLTAAEIRDMPIEEYAQYRPQLLAAGNERVRTQGIYAP